MLGDFFYQDREDKDLKKEELLCEWAKFKYNLVGLRSQLPPEIARPNASKTPSEWLLEHMLSMQSTYQHLWPCLLELAEVCLSLPVNTAAQYGGRRSHVRSVFIIATGILSRSVSKVILLFLLSSFSTLVSSCGKKLYRTAYLPGNKARTCHSAQNAIILRAFSKAKIPYYPNSSATYSTRRIMLSLNPGMTNGNGNDTRIKTKRKQRSINIAHLNVRSLKNKEHFILAKDLAKKHKLDIFTI